MKRESKKDSKSKESYGKYFIAGIIFAALVYLVIMMLDTTETDITGPRTWSKEVEEAFVKSCYEKYQSQITTEDQRIRMNSFCRCMLSKMKSKYEESEMNRISDADLRVWDKECRDDVGQGAIY